MNRVCLLVALCLALLHPSKSVNDQHTGGICLTLQRTSNLCAKTRRGRSHKGRNASPPWSSLSCKQISIVKRPKKLCKYLFYNPIHPHGRNKRVHGGEKQSRDDSERGNKTTPYPSVGRSESRRYYKGDYHAPRSWSIFSLHDGCEQDRDGVRRKQITDPQQDDNASSRCEENELMRRGNAVEEVNERGGARNLSANSHTDGTHSSNGTAHSNEENLSKAMKQAEEYIKGKEDDVLERREVQKKKEIIENLKGQEDAFTDKFLDLGMYDVLKHVYEEGLCADSKSLVEAVCRWMRRAYEGGVAEKGAEEKTSPRMDNSPDTAYLVEKDLADNYSPGGGEKIVNHFQLDPPGGKKGSAQVESLKLYNRKNLKKYFLSLNRGNILKQLVIEGEDEILDSTEESRRKRNDVEKLSDEQVREVISSNSILNCDLDTYVDKERYLQSNVTVEFNIYDTFSDRVILNNRNTNSTMLEFPLMYSHHIIQKCILTMKKLEKAIFYINNNFLFGLFSPQEEPMNEDDRRVYDVITNESWVKMEIYLCNIYRMDEEWMGITPETFADEARASSFLQSYSGGGASNLVCNPGGGSTSAGQMGELHSTLNGNRTATSGEDRTSPLHEDQSATSNRDPPCTTSEDAIPGATSVEGTLSRRREEIERRREEYESKKDIAIKSEFLMKKLENEMKYDPNHYMWRDLYPQLDDRGKERTDKYFKNFQKEMTENKCSRGYTDNIKKKQQLKGYDIGEKIEGRAKHYIWQETIHAFILYFPLRPYITKEDINIDMDNTFFFLSIRGHTIVKDFFNKPINSADSIWSLTDREEDIAMGNMSMQREHGKAGRGEFPLLEITHMDDSDIQKMMKRKYCLVYNIYKDNNHKYMWGSIFKAS
ncbi:conserved Plasmodium protein, unknown function [Plasmodium knowlesi strain H]|uniref:CS domain-containing protein n=3 Tax=Plasmodium knowlesi TaxID=5850 RepID=A0A5K1V8D4_PLAKH|nr:conserved protein, unknown function [Plasmodium knowlesi strain H]OTN66007.1 Uncharacterized protein PKNOH_S100053900 [Plasmodium knowlesi]CAA9987897.1 conserved protein, unknown function [Plasmodium knowlesi strain H]SBO22258.1 conserved Plasmodium protein, unknown function [Plasmodium knowlesi strain H]SBO28830.1 conserved Plasmodium protein, unknown function [Plasmodium knowlesi strain H]VVS77371.1 conserved protein, unknown function [Plasmodium knowlesi strain H]|eukprot:XP_002258895.1 hypothetical protein, conserved in Plasmodium species [Plasmodium knowlesi strain H]